MGRVIKEIEIEGKPGVALFDTGSVRPSSSLTWNACGGVSSRNSRDSRNNSIKISHLRMKPAIFFAPLRLCVSLLQSG